MQQSPATTSRYAVYRYEIDNNLVSEWSGNGNANTGGTTNGNGENGAPLCAGAGNGVDTSTGGPDRQSFLRRSSIAWRKAP